MARDCIFYSEENDMGATIPFCNFENSSDWNCCKYFDLRDSTQELCPHYISRREGLEILRKSFAEEAEDTISEEDALKFIDRLMLINDTLRREIVMSDAIMSIGKEAE